NDAQKGMTYIFQSLNSWLYADDPFAGLEWEKPLAYVKTALETDLFEKMITEQILDNPHSLLLTMNPIPGLESKRKTAIQTECDDYKAGLDGEEIQTLLRETKELVEYQKREDTPEALATIPMLKLEDINPKAEWYPVSEEIVADVPELYYDAFTNHIVYTRMFFDVQVLPIEMIPYASLLTIFLGNLNTDNYSYGDLDNALNIHTGGFNTYLTSYLEDESDEKMLAKFAVFSKVTNTKTGKLFELSNEILNHSNISDKDRVKILLTRHLSRLEANVKNNGFGYTRTRLTSYYSNQGMFNELKGGLDYYWFVADLVNNFDENADELIEKLQNTAAKLFTKDNLLVTVTCSKDDLQGFNEELAEFATYLSDEKSEKQTWDFNLETKNEGFQTVSKVQYVIKGYDYKKLGYDWNGKIRVMNQILSREWLTNQIRVIGGAYGGFSNFSSSGQVYFGSYRDPNLKSTLENIDASPEFLENFEPSEDVMTRFIIGTISKMDKPLTPSDKGNVAVSRYLRNVTAEDVQKDRDDVLSTTPEDVRGMSKFVEEILKQNAYCVYGNEEKVGEHKDLFKKVIKLD
ncbi:MAG: peptidase, partial [Candidatus Marinimicrobia bacterium]|nr:peptidase [Candidatus Neomarinimicrobiota bacterium]